MPPRAKLSDVIDGMETVGDETQAYFDRHTGEVVSLTNDELSDADDELEGGDEGEEKGPRADWQQEQIELAKAIHMDTGDRFVPLPDKFEINEWEMMRDFALEQRKPEHAEALERAIHGRGAFRYFKDRLCDLGLEKEWYKFRDAQYRKLALEWAERHGIEVDVAE